MGSFFLPLLAFSVVIVVVAVVFFLDLMLVSWQNGRMAEWVWAVPLLGSFYVVIAVVVMVVAVVFYFSE